MGTRSIAAWLTRPIILGLCSAALGAGSVILVVGVPSLWSAEASGWAAAAGSTAAVVVALYLGVAPHLGRQRVAAAIAIAVYGRLQTQQMHLDACRQLCAPTQEMDEHLFRLAMENFKMDSTFADPLLPYFDVLSDGQAKSLGAAIADLESATTLLSFAAGRDSYFMAGISAPRFFRVLEPVVKSLQRARVELAPFATEKPAEDLTQSVQVIVDGSKRLAQSSREMSLPHG